MNSHLIGGFFSVYAHVAGETSVCDERSKSRSTTALNRRTFSLSLSNGVYVCCCSMIDDDHGCLMSDEARRTRWS